MIIQNNKKNNKEVLGAQLLCYIKKKEVLGAHLILLHKE